MRRPAPGAAQAVGELVELERRLAALVAAYPGDDAETILAPISARLALRLVRALQAVVTSRHDALHCDLVAAVTRAMRGEE